MALWNYTRFEEISSSRHSQYILFPPNSKNSWRNLLGKLEFFRKISSKSIDLTRYPMILVKILFIQWFWGLILGRKFSGDRIVTTVLSYIPWKSSRGTITMAYPIVIMFVYVIKLDKKIRLIFKTIFRDRSCVALISSSSKVQNTVFLMKFIKITVFSS